MTITSDDVIELSNQFHEVVMNQKGTAKDQSNFFLYPDKAMIYLMNGEDITLQKNYEIHQQLKNEVHIPQDKWTVTPLCGQPEKARAQGYVYWEGTLINSDNNNPIKCFVGEDWIVQRTPDGELKFVLYINAYHHFLPDSADISL
jgi:hypothetical protein